MLLEEFIELVNDEISVSCSIPFKLPEKEIVRIIKYDALKWFYKNYEYSLEPSYLYIPHEVMTTAEFKAKKYLVLPDCVFSITRLQETKGNSLYRGDFNIEKMYLRDVYTAQNFDIEGLAYYVINEMYFDLSEQILGTEMKFNFNYLTHRLHFLGEEKSSSVVATILKTIPDDKMFDDDYFLEYVVSKSMIQLGRILGTVQMPLIGNATIDYDSFKSMGQERLEALKQLIKEEEGLDYFYFSP